MIRSVFARLFPNMYKRMEAESRTWIIQCTKCGHEISVWDAGGIRYKARGTPRRRGKCTACGQVSWLRVYRHPDHETRIS